MSRLIRYGGLSSQRLGFTTLLCVALLLVLTMTSNLVTHARLLAASKQSRMALQQAQQYWIAEGGLVCAYAQLLAYNGAPTQFSRCQLPQQLQLTSESFITLGGEPLTRLKVNMGTTQLQLELLPSAVSAANGYDVVEGSWRDF